MLHGRELINLEIKNRLLGLTPTELARTQLLYKQRRSARWTIQVLGLIICLASIGPCLQSMPSLRSDDRDFFWLTIWTVGMIVVYLGGLISSADMIKANAYKHVTRQKLIPIRYDITD